MMHTDTSVFFFDDSVNNDRNNSSDHKNYKGKVIESSDGIKGDTASNVQKPAKLETGLMVQVPLFIKEGEIIKVSTADGTYLGRV